MTMSAYVRRVSWGASCS